MPMNDTHFQLTYFIILRWVIPVVLSKYEYVRNNVIQYIRVQSQNTTMYYKVCLLYLLQRHVSAFNGHHQVVYENL